MTCSLKSRSRHFLGRYMDFSTQPPKIYNRMQGWDSCLMFFLPLCFDMFPEQPPTLMASIAVKSGMIVHARVVIWAGISAADKRKAAIGCIECVNVHLQHPTSPPRVARILLFKSSYCREFGWLLGDLFALGV